jgi:hypothetical protein
MGTARWAGLNGMFTQVSTCAGAFVVVPILPGEGNAAG